MPGRRSTPGSPGAAAAAGWLAPSVRSPGSAQPCRISLARQRSRANERCRSARPRQLHKTLTPLYCSQMQHVATRALTCSFATPLFQFHRTACEGTPPRLRAPIRPEPGAEAAPAELGVRAQQTSPAGRSGSQQHAAVPCRAGKLAERRALGVSAGYGTCLAQKPHQLFQRI